MYSCYCCGSEKTHIRNGKSRWRHNKPTDLVLCHNCNRWLTYKINNKRIRYFQIPNFVECYGCRLQSIIIFRASCISRWIKNYDTAGQLLHVLCDKCWFNIIHYKRKYPMGSNYHKLKIKDGINTGKTHPMWGKKHPCHGERHHLWNGGITKLHKKIRNSSEYNRWRYLIFERDGFKCQNCHENGRLNVHHLKPFNIIVKENNIKTFEDALNCKYLWDIKNGVTLCKKHHIETDICLKNRKLKK